MERKVYNVSGFDCPVCAAKTAKYIANQKGIKAAEIDFEKGKLYIDYKKEVWDLEKVKSLIADVEGDEVSVSEE